jgi:ABC-type transport system involved in cytochrome c biogenesis permease subunit
MGYLIFQITLFTYILATAGYIVYFWSQRNEIRTAARRILIGAGVLHLLYFIVRYFEAGHTPLSNHHETISFFALSLTWGYLSFHWRYHVRNFGTFVSPLITFLMVIATFSSREITPLPPELKSAARIEKSLAAGACLHCHNVLRVSGSRLLRRHHVSPAGKGAEK